MNKKIARELLQQEFEELRTRSYDSLRDELLEEPRAEVAMGRDGKPYQIEVHAFWDDRLSGNIRVTISIDDGRGWRAFFPMHDGFIISPSGEFVGE